MAYEAGATRYARLAGCSFIDLRLCLAAQLPFRLFSFEAAPFPPHQTNVREPHLVTCVQLSTRDEIVLTAGQLQSHPAPANTESHLDWTEYNMPRDDRFDTTFYPHDIIHTAHGIIPVSAPRGFRSPLPPTHPRLPERQR